jgi:hypothetical protein
MDRDSRAGRGQSNGEMNKDGTMTTLADEARVLFDNYQQATPSSEFKRLKELGPQHFLYFEPHLQADMAVFAGVLANLWEGLRDRTVFAQHFKSKRQAFSAIREMIVPQTPHAEHTRFWSLNGGALTSETLWNEQVAYNMCRTLRNGFSHFHFRYVDDPPVAYFKRMN